MAPDPVRRQASEHALTGSAPTVGVAAPAADRQRLIAILENEGIAARPLTARREGASPDAIVLALESPAGAADELRRTRASHGPARLVLVVKTATPAEARHLLVDDVAGLVFAAEVGLALGPSVQAALAGQIAYPAGLMPGKLNPALSTREKQVLAMVVLGFSNAEIAAKLHVSESTVKSHLSSSFHTLGVRSRKEAVALILDPDAGFGTGILAITDSASIEGSSRLTDRG